LTSIIASSRSGGSSRKGPYATDASVGDGDVEPAEARHDGLGREPDRRPIAHVAAHAEPALEPEIGATAREQADRRAGAVERAGHRRPDPAAGPGDQGDPSIELSHQASSSPPRRFRLRRPPGNRRQCASA
jgi:hypothetical protein